MIRTDLHTSGIKINHEEHKILQFADDSKIFLNGSQTSFQKTIKVVDRFGKALGLKINYDKTEAIWLGSFKNSSLKFMPELKIHWNPQTFKILDYG